MLEVVGLGEKESRRPLNDPSSIFWQKLSGKFQVFFGMGNGTMLCS